MYIVEKFNRISDPVKTIATMFLRIPFLLFALFFFSFPLFAQRDSVAERIILVGDAGKFDMNNKNPELDLIRKMYDLNKEHTTILFLGDNIYPQGLPSAYANNYLEKKAILDSQINVVSGTKAKAYFMAGNHDWMQGAPSGWQQVINQYRYITGLQRDNVMYVPSSVCPGPEEISLSDRMTLVVIDSQWWLHAYDKPGATSGCEFQTKDQLLAALKDIVFRNMNKVLIFAAHHPFVTYGRHGGYFTIKQHIFPFTEINPKLYIPLPIIGSIYPISRGVFGNIQDTRHPTYKNFSSAVDSILRMHPYCLRVAGHEHTLQMIELQNQFYIVSGAGSKMSSISKKKPSLLYASDKTGFAVIERNYNGNVYVRFFSSMNDTAQNPIYAKMLPSIDTTAVKVKPYTIPLLPDSITIAGRDYSAGKIKKLFLGSNYRKEWGASLRIPVFNIGKEYGGLNPNRRGGGMQTKSLRLVDKNGQEFVLRSIEKFPDNAIPEEFRETFIKDLVVDGISASYPYAALSIPILSEAAHVPHAKPRLVYVPDDPRFGFYQSEFKNSIAIFEEREPGRYGNNVGTEKVLENMIGDNDNRIDQRALVKARLLDLFIMDFDRHEDQWRWGNIDTGKGKVYFPIPRDRDQAFFVNEGIIPRQVRKPWFLPSIQGFRAKAHNIITFNYNARLFDRVFLNQATRKVWEDSTDALISEMTDDVIEKALRSQPPEIFAYSGPKIIETLKKRRNYLKKEAIEYYKYLAKEVEVTGSDKKEFFDILRKDDGTLDVTVHKINKEGKLAGTMYQRTFYQKETKEVQLFGMGGADSFRISGNDARGIKVRLIGGTGDDVFENVSHVSKKRNILYDLRSEDNVIKGTFRQELSFDPSVNQPNRNRKYVRYNLWHPTLAFTYNRDDGIFAGGSIRFTKQGFRKFPFKVEHRLSGTHALATKAYQFKYTMERISFFRNNDLLLSGLLRAPNYTLNFFGYGNESNYNKENSIRFYRTRFDQAEASIMLRNRVAEYVTVAAGPVYNFASVSRDDNEGRIVFHPAAVNLDSAHLYQDKNYLGAQGVITVDNRNDLIMPSRGVYWVTTYRNFGGLGQSSNKYSQLNSDMTVYISSNQPARFIFVVRFGAGWSYGKYEFFQAQTLSGTDNLRGYRRSRFAGDKVMFNNTEIRWRIKDFRTYLFPGTFGLLAFHDVGRVWLKGEHSSVWHTGYGGGFWLSPAHRSVLSVSYGISKEGGLPIISLGFQF